MKKTAPQPAADSADEKTAAQLNKLARQQLTQGLPDDAEQTLLMSLQHAKTPDGLRLMGNTLFIKERLKEALPYFQEALALDENDHASYAMMAEILFASGDLQSIAYSMTAMSKAPEQHRYKDRFVHFAPHFAFKDYNDFIENAILECLKTEEVDCTQLQSLWLNTFSLNPRFAAFYKTYHSADPATRTPLSRFKTVLGGFSHDKKDYVFFDAAHFARQADLQPLIHPFFLLGLARLRVLNVAFEEFLTKLRERLLAEIDAPRLNDSSFVALTAALARYCYETGYIFAITPAEGARCAALKQEIEAAIDLGPLVRKISILSCYQSLQTLANAEALHGAFAKVDFLDETTRQQIEWPETLRRQAAGIESLTPITDETSKKIQAHYDAFPYPLWSAKPRDISHEGVGLLLQEGVKKILVAGCGTGYEAAQVATVFPAARVTAIDLSKPSLGYASLKANEFGMGNIRFQQGDILNLEGTADRYDGIFCSGVLQHLADPVEGLRALAAKLAPLGVIRVSLYSKTAHEFIAKVQAAVTQGRYPATIEGMRAFRQDAARLLPHDVYEALTDSEDYYQLPLLLDLVFNVPNKGLSLPELKSALAALKLTFIKMTVPAEDMTAFQKIYTDDPAGVDLDHWHDFERRHPETFSHIYQFWCQKQ